MLKNRITWLALGLIAALGIGAFAAPPLNLMPVYLWLGAGKVNASNPLPVVAGGGDADGTAVSGNPLRIAGKDGSGNLQDILVSTEGRPSVDINSGNMVISGAIELIGKTLSFEETFTRPGDTTTYAPGDVVGTSPGAEIVFDGVAVAGRGGIITDAVMSMSTAASLKLEAELWLFHTAPTDVADNSAFNPSDAEADDVIAVIPFSSSYGAVGGSNYVYHVKNLNIGFHPAGSGTDIYGVLVARNAYIPGNAEVFNIRLHILQD